MQEGLVTINDEVGNLMKTCDEYPLRKVLGECDTGPIRISPYPRLKSVRDQLEKEGQASAAKGQPATLRGAVREPRPVS